MAETTTTTLTVNGTRHEVTASPDAPLLHVLREELGLRAARLGCGQGTCGACTVIVDGKAVASCDTPLGTVAGATVETAESLDGDTPHPILEEMLRFQAGQCGFCLSGIAMSAKALLDATPGASDADIRAALDGNLCRCGAHVRILRAVQAAAARMEG